jgi:hypothetical protein
MDEPVVALSVTIPAGETAQVTVLSVALAGSTVAVSWNVPPGVSSRDILSRVRDDTSTGLTVTVYVPEAGLPYWVVAVIIAVPGATAVIDALR